MSDIICLNFKHMLTLLCTILKQKPIMWGNKKKQAQTSEFFKGINIFDQLGNSIFGKIKQTISEIFTTQEIKQYTLPKVIVIGNESTGKSSLLENITKCQLFPRDSKLCTRAPINVKLTNGPSKYTISYPVINQGTESRKFIELKNKNEIYSVINEYMKKLPGDHISELEILIEITDYNVPTFEFYDLPGIRTYPPESAEMTTKLCRKYLSDKNSIVLCVVPATTPRLTSCQSIALISEMGMEHNCILALTMADKLQPDDIEELLIKRIIRTSDELDGLNFAGYIAVTNRIHTDSHSLEENDANENKWFYENIVQCIPNEYNTYAQKIKDNITISNLVSKMDELYNEFIHKDWKPRILTTISSKIGDLESEYKNMGEKNIESSELNNVIGEFVDSIYDNLCQSYNTNFTSLDKFFQDVDVDVDVHEDADEEVFIKKKNDVIEEDNVNDNIHDNVDKNKKFHECIKLFNRNIQICVKFNILRIEKTIDEYFEFEEHYKLARFEKVKNDLKCKMNNYFVDLTADYINKINMVIEKRIMLHYLDNCMKSSYNNDLYQLYKLLILYPLLKIKIDYSFEDYIESDTYQQKRQNILQSIAHTKKHYNIINTLPDMSHNTINTLTNKKESCAVTVSAAYKKKIKKRS